LLISGTGLMFTGLVFPQGEQTYDGGNFFIGWISNDEYKNDDLRDALFLGGGIVALGSIPFFIASGMNKRKAKKTTFFIDMERAEVLQYANVRHIAYPVLGLRLKL